MSVFGLVVDADIAASSACAVARRRRRRPERHRACRRCRRCRPRHWQRHENWQGHRNLQPERQPQRLRHHRLHHRCRHPRRRNINCAATTAGAGAAYHGLARRDSGKRTMGCPLCSAPRRGRLRPYQLISSTGRPDRPWTGASACPLIQGLPHSRRSLTASLVGLAAPVRRWRPAHSEQSAPALPSHPTSLPSRCRRLAGRSCRLHARPRIGQ